ncbi:unnamed protein product [Clavelina lepadiformis]|uniref:Uncharacterized protein n=1 Tax=Clavelina lepadiformis TaxID=159417 RepID=A0ABP0EXU9_CLALP
MMMNEAKAAEKGQKGLSVIRVLHHKTGLTCGPAQIVVRPPVMEALLSFIRVSKEQKYVFEWRGEQFSSSHAAKAMQHVCKAAVPKGRKLTATMVRKCTATQIRAKNPQQREMVAGHMAHLPSTQEAHYINPLQCDESVVAFEAIQSLYEEGETSRSVLPEPSAGPSQPSSEPHSELTSPEEVRTTDEPQNKDNPVTQADVTEYKK